MNEANPPTPYDVDALLAEQRRRWEAGDPLTVAAILERNPALRGRSQTVLDLINHEVVLRSEFGTPASREEFFQHFPELRDELALLFEVHDALEHDASEPEKLDPYATVAPSEPSGAGPSCWPVVPNYTITALLGEGGMGVVYKAVDQRLKRPVALKMIRGHGAGPEERRRFQAEAEAVAKLDHPGIVHIYEVGEYDRQPFFALEYVDGGSLRGQIDRKPKPAMEAAQIVASLASSMQYAHNLGIIHRDLKPDNVLLQKKTASPASSFAERFHLKIADFGLAKQVEAGSQSQRTQAIIGTPSYMAPEQAGDFTVPIGPAADVYALGAILYELLTGRPPFCAANTLDTLEQVRSQDPVPPTRLQPKCPRDLETICLKCLRKDPRDRYDSAQDLADDLRRFLRHEPVRARPASTWKRVRLWCRRRPLVALLLGAIGLLLLIVTVVPTYLLVRALSAEEQTQAQLYDARINLAHQHWDANQCRPMRAVLESLRPNPGHIDRRDFEWYYLWGLLHQEKAILPCEECAIYSPNGALLACGWESEVRLWQTASLQAAPRALLGSSDRVTRIAFSPKGDQLAAAAADHTVRVWDVVSGKLLHKVGTHPDSVTSIAFSLGGVATACRDGIVRLWEGDDESPRLQFDEHDGPVSEIAFTPDGKRLVSAGSKDRLVVVRDVASGRALLLKGHTGAVLSVATHGNRIASSGIDRSLRLWDAETGKLLDMVGGLPTFVQHLAFRGDGARLAGACFDHGVRIWDTAPKQKLTSEPVQWLRGLDAMSGLTFAPTGDRLAVVGRDGSMRVLDAERNPEAAIYDLPPGVVSAVAPDGETLAIIDRDSSIRLHQWRTGKSQAVPSGLKNTGKVLAVCLAGDGTLVWAGSDGLIRSWNAEQGAVKDLCRGPARSTVAAADARGDLLAIGGMDGNVRLWRLKSGVEVGDRSIHTAAVTDVAFSPNGQRIASAGQDGFVVISDMSSGAVLHRFGDTDHTPQTLAFSADGRFLAAGDKQSTVRVWDVVSGKRVHYLQGHDGGVQAVAFSRNGRRLASASADWTVKLWDLTTGLELLTLRGPGREVTAAAFVGDDEALLALGRTPTLQTQVRLWARGIER